MPQERGNGKALGNNQESYTAQITDKELKEKLIASNNPIRSSPADTSNNEKIFPSIKELFGYNRPSDFLAAMNRDHSDTACFNLDDFPGPGSVTGSSACQPPADSQNHSHSIQSSKDESSNAERHIKGSRPAKSISGRRSENTSLKGRYNTYEAGQHANAKRFRTMLIILLGLVAVNKARYKGKIGKMITRPILRILAKIKKPKFRHPFRNFSDDYLRRNGFPIPCRDNRC